MMTYRSALSAVFMLALLSGCAAVEDRPTPDDEPRPETLEEMLQAAEDAEDLSASQRFRLQAAQKYQERDEYEASRQLLQAMADEDMSDDVRDQFYVISLNQALSTGDRRLARTLSRDVDPELPGRVPEALQVRTLRMQEDVHRLAGHPFGAAHTLILNPDLDDELTGQARKDRIWRYLRDTRESVLEEAAREISDHGAQGWVELALLVRAEDPHALEGQATTIRRWQENWSDHEAAEELPRELALIAQLPESRPQELVLALPLSGSLASAGQAIREGFMAALYQSYEQSDERPPRVRVLDTADESFESVYARALEENPDLIIGPLSRDEVERLGEQDRLPIPVLALNYLKDRGDAPENLYQFGLSGEDEARQVAERMRRDGHRNALIIAPDGDWGDRMVQIFGDRHEALDGRVLEKTRYDSRENLNQVVSSAFGINVSRQRASTLQRTTGIGMQFEPRRRQDIDAIVLLAPPGQARQFNPLFAFYYGADLPVYGTSLLYAGTSDPTRDNDLDGIRFVDIPWTITPDEDLRPVLHQLFPSLATRNDRLFALGADSFRLSGRLPVLEEVEGAWMEGATGRLTMRDGNAIYRQLPWARFRRGAVELDPLSEEEVDDTPELPGVVQRINR